MDALHWWRQGDAVTQGAAVVLLAMSVASWVVMLWKARLVLRAGGDVARCTAAVWQSPSLDVAAQRLAALDSQALVMTAAGLAVAIPAVLAYNVFGRLLGRIEADLEGFARDLRELIIDTQSPPALQAPLQPPSQTVRAG